MMMCPICSRMGIGLLVAGLGCMVLSSFAYFLFWVGLALVISAYIAPTLYAEHTKKGKKCMSSCNSSKDEANGCYSMEDDN